MLVLCIAAVWAATNAINIDNINRSKGRSAACTAALELCYIIILLEVDCICWLQSLCFAAHVFLYHLIVNEAIWMLLLQLPNELQHTWWTLNDFTQHLVDGGEVNAKFVCDRTSIGHTRQRF